jgi:HAD superfamily hydrolase (TIGR01509 family)
VTEAVVFDLDGVLLDSEDRWDAARRALVAERGGTWPEGGTADMQGMSSPEWSAYLATRAGLDLDPAAVNQLVVARLLAGYDRDLPLLPGAVAAVGRLGSRWPLGLASSSNREVIERVLGDAGLRGAFAVVLSSEEVARGKPAPDVYAEAARRLGRDPAACVAVEDSANGVRSALDAGLAVVALPRPGHPLPGELAGRAALVLDDLSGLTVPALDPLGRAP